MYEISQAHLFGSLYITFTQACDAFSSGLFTAAGKSPAQACARPASNLHRFIAKISSLFYPTFIGCA
jgi:hypothetical protein